VGSELEKALTQLETLGKRGERPSHYLARHLLIELGQALAQGPADALVARARAAGEAVSAAWTQAIETELSLACGEFAQSVDPRYLALPSYDVGYTRTARARLGDRLRAAAELGFALAPREAEVLTLADQVFEAFLRQRGEGHGTENGAPEAAEGGSRNDKSPPRQEPT
jgi:hypothetical protein